MNRLRTAESVRQVAPGHTRMVAIEDCLDKQAVVPRRYADMVNPARRQTAIRVS